MIKYFENIGMWLLKYSLKTSIFTTILRILVVWLWYIQYTLPPLKNPLKISGKYFEKTPYTFSHSYFRILRLRKWKCSLFPLPCFFPLICWLPGCFAIRAYNCISLFSSMSPFYRLPPADGHILPACLRGGQKSQNRKWRKFMRQ